MLIPCLGIPVRYDPGMREISEARGLWRWREIVVGPKFTAFPPREGQAFLLHEAAHCKMRHLEKRLLWMLLTPWRIARVCRAQEFEADRFVWHCGYGPDLARGFARILPTKSPLHPPLHERIARLTASHGC